MGYSVEGDYFETCNCTVACQCIMLSPATNDSCQLFLAWHITRGKKDGVDLSGLNVALAIYSPKQMTDGGWKVALYLDDRAKPDQASALGAIFSGQAGGQLAAVVPLIGTVTGVAAAPISFEKTNGKRHLKVGQVLEMDSEELKGFDGKTAPVISNNPLTVVPAPLRVARAGRIRYEGAWKFEGSGTNGFTTEFKYEA
jgi:hypothetical protein